MPLNVCTTEGKQSSSEEASATGRLTRPFLIATGIYAAVTLVILIASLRAAGGHLVYALDDT